MCETIGDAMDTQMFCFQCEQTAGCSGCTSSRGTCGKTAHTAALQDQLTSALVDLACVAHQGGVATQETYHRIIEGLFVTVTNVNFDDKAIETFTQGVREHMSELAAHAKVELPDAYNVETLWQAEDTLRSLKSLILFGLRGMGAYAHHAWVLGYTDEGMNRFFVEGLASLADETLSVDDLIALSLKVGEVNLTCMALLDKANTKTYGTPSPTEVEMKIEPGPFIVVSGHDLHDLYLLLEQTKGTGVSVYTHGEMLPAHGYPELRKYDHLKGHFGTAWQNQQKEFAQIPGAFLFTTNCLMPPRDSYADRVFTTSVVGYEGLQHIGEDKDFAPVIAKAKELGGFGQTQQFFGTNGGTVLSTGFGHGTILGLADTVVGAVQSGAIKHFFLVGGCDGARSGRNYFSEFVDQAPQDSIILTLGCGKFRFNDRDLGDIGGIPRLLDMGQCNDAYGAIQVALALADAFKCEVNELPLSLVLSWYEQKAVCILLTLLHLGIKGIRLGPTLPAFVSPAVLEVLVNTFELAPISTPEDDLKALM